MSDRAYLINYRLEIHVPLMRQYYSMCHHPMSIFPDFLRSLLLTMILSFLTPILLISLGWVSFILIGWLPNLEHLGQSYSNQILQFLATFGSGNPIQGSLVIGMTCSFVGALFDTYAASQHSRSQ